MVKPELTDSTISLLLECREIFKKYAPILEKDQEDANTLQDLVYELAVTGKFTDMKKFEYFNEAMNMLEYDRCFRIRPARDPNTETPKPEDFCINGSGCSDRGLVPCTIDPTTVACYNREWGVLHLLPPEKSQMCIEYRQHAQNAGVDPSKVVAPHPLFCIGSHAVCPDTDLPPRCLGVSVKIEEPRFDVYWGMERAFRFALFAHNIRESLSNG